mgnify:CR=1 FL=1
MIITKVDLKQQDSKGQRLKSEDNMNMASNDKGLIWSILILVENSSKTVFVIQGNVYMPDNNNQSHLCIFTYI